MKAIAPENVQKEEVLKEFLKRLKIDIDEEIGEPPVCISILEDGESFPLFSMGNFSAIIGKPKSRKTFMASMAIAAAMKNDSILSKFQASLPQIQNRVVLIDTEQSKYHVQKVVKRICALADINRPMNFDTYGLRTLSTDERLAAISLIIESTENLGFVIIDGIKDLVLDINSQEEANKIVNLLLKWSEQKNIHICVVLHQNKGDNNARGHLGTEIVNKAETVLSVKKECDTSTVQVEYSRDKEFPPFSFCIDPNGIPLITKSENKPSGRKKVLGPYDLEPEAHFIIIREMFNGEKELSRGDLVPLLVDAFSKKGTTMGLTRGKEFIVRYIKERWIAAVRQSGKYKYYRNMV